MSATTNRRWMMGGSVLVAAVSSACCWLPLIALGLGFSAVGLGGVFETFRWVFIALAAGFLAGAFVLRHRDARACADSTCRPAGRLGGSGWLYGVAALTLAFAVFPEVLELTGSSDDGTALVADEADGRTALTREYVVEGMTCEGCTTLLVDYFQEQAEVKAATVTYETKLARVVFAAGITGPQADQVMERMREEWDTYTFTLSPSS